VTLLPCFSWSALKLIWEAAIMHFQNVGLDLLWLRTSVFSSLAIQVARQSSNISQSTEQRECLDCNTDRLRYIPDIELTFILWFNIHQKLPVSLYCALQTSSFWLASGRRILRTSSGPPNILTDISWYFSNSGYYLKLSHDRLLSHHVKFIIHQSSFQLTIPSWIYWHRF
jgi:hypothetical protein